VRRKRRLGGVTEGNQGVGRQDVEVKDGRSEETGRIEDLGREVVL
jgi:hypothetical protein